MGYAACPQRELDEVQKLLKKEMMAAELACASREKAEAELSEVSLFESEPKCYKHFLLQQPLDDTS